MVDASEPAEYIDLVDCSPKFFILIGPRAYPKIYPKFKPQKNIFTIIVEKNATASFFL